MRRGLNQADAAEFRQLRWRDVLPVLPPIARDMDKAVIGAGPDRVCLHTRRSDAKDGAVNFGAILIVRDRTAGIAERVRIVAREIGTNALPALPFVRGLEQVLRGGD